MATVTNRLLHKSINGWLSGEPNISHNLYCICNKWIFQTIEFSAISTTDNSEYKLWNLVVSVSESLVKYNHLQMMVC